MVNASWTARPPDPRCPLASFDGISPTLPTQTPSVSPAGFLVFGPVLGSYHPSFRAGDRGSAVRLPSPSPFVRPAPDAPMPDHPHTIDRWDDATGENLVEQIAAVGDYLSRWRPTVRRSEGGPTTKSRCATGRG